MGKINLSINSNFWLNKKVFITGHTGFKGSWLLIWLEMLGAKIKGYSLPPNTYPNLFEEANLKKGIISDFGDIRDFKKLKIKYKKI